ncbi:unnamed protein product [Haemonchus placei]|uniref:Transposase n=1 Tax=Haemonchus placei TaxID=6290 RepID=A0A0N4WQL6_HAEPC|nr:unnamed protein product [Haemonchus placei]
MDAASPIPSLFRRLSRSFVEHWCRIADDYRTVAKETAAACLKKPSKAGCILAWVLLCMLTARVIVSWLQ